MRLGRRFGRLPPAAVQPQRLHLLGAEQVLPVAVFVPARTVGFDGMLDALAAVAALQVIGAAIFVAAPADAVGMFGGNGKFFGHRVCGKRDKRWEGKAGIMCRHRLFRTLLRAVLEHAVVCRRRQTGIRRLRPGCGIR